MTSKGTRHFYHRNSSSPSLNGWKQALVVGKSVNSSASKLSDKVQVMRTVTESGNDSLEDRADSDCDKVSSTKC